MANDDTMKLEFLDPADVVVTRDAFNSLDITDRKTGKVFSNVDIRLITPISKSTSTVCIYIEETPDYEMPQVKAEQKEIAAELPAAAKGTPVIRETGIMREVAIIKDYNKLNPDSRDIIIEAIEKKYFIPNIIRINGITEEYQMRHWETETDKGYQEFYTRSNNDIFVKNFEVFIRDIDSNRYVIRDYSKMDDKSQRILKLEI